MPTPLTPPTRRTIVLAAFVAAVTLAAGLASLADGALRVPDATTATAVVGATTSTSPASTVPPSPALPPIADPRFDAPPTTAGAPSTTSTATSAAPGTTSTATTGAVPTPSVAALTGPPQLAPRGAGVPVGKGMWIWMPERADGGDPAAIVARALAADLTHIYVRTGSSRQGVEGTGFLEGLLPVAHDAGLRVYGWDFPYLEDIAGDVERAMAAINFRTTTGHRIDGFVPDIETGAEGTNLTAEGAAAYSQALRAAVGDDYPLIACVPNPTPRRMETFPYAAIIPSFDAVAPMVYWLNRQPDTDVAHAVTWLSQFGKPVIPIGQAYDGGPEGGRPGPPPPDEIQRFLATAARYGATGASFWSWQHATPEIWDAIDTAPQMTIPVEESPLDRLQLMAVQTQLTSMGYWAPATGIWDSQTIHAVTVFQIDLGLAPTGALDGPTRNGLLGPLAPPVGR